MKIVYVNLHIQKASLKYTCDCGNKGHGLAGVIPFCKHQLRRCERYWLLCLTAFFSLSWNQVGCAKQSPEGPFQHSALLWFCDLVLVALIEDLTDGLCSSDLWPGQWPLVRCTVTVCHTFPISKICVIATFSFCSCGMRIDMQKTLRFSDMYGTI